MYSEQEIVELLKAYKRQGDTALRDRAFLSALAIVKTEVGRFLLHVPSTVDRGDLEAAAAAGLLQAVERYDTGSGVPFRYFASLRIRGAILDELRRMDLLGRDTRRRVEAIRQAERRLRNRGREPSDEDIAREAGLAFSEFVDAELADHASRLAAVAENEEDPGMPAFARGPAPEEAVENHELVTRALQSLNEREKALVTLHYYEGLTLREISRVLGLSEGRISQIHAEMLQRLRRLLL